MKSFEQYLPSYFNYLTGKDHEKLNILSSIFSISLKEIDQQLKKLGSEIFYFKHDGGSNIIKKCLLESLYDYPEIFEKMLPCLFEYFSKRGTQHGFRLIIEKCLNIEDFEIRERSFPRENFKIGQDRLTHYKSIYTHRALDKSVIFEFPFHKSQFDSKWVKTVWKFCQDEMPLGHFLFFIFSNFKKQQKKYLFKLGDQI